MPKVYNDGTGDGLREFDYRIKRFERVNGARIRCYDNGGKTADRYTVIYLDEPEQDTRTGAELFACVGMSADPFHPQGFGQHSTAQDGRHLGKRVAFAALPKDCRALVMQDTALTGYDGKRYNVGDRVELHPRCDLWMRGAKFGTVHSVSLTPEDRVKVRMGHPSVKNLVAGPADRFRKVRS